MGSNSGLRPHPARADVAQHPQGVGVRIKFAQRRQNRGVVIGHGVEPAQPGQLRVRQVQVGGEVVHASMVTQGSDGRDRVSV
mgnify:CR=1 FL=1